MANYFTIIVVCEFDSCGIKQNQFLKYHNIKKDRLQRFWKFARQIPDLHHINFYDAKKPKGKNFVKQVRAAEILEGTAAV